MGREDGRVEKFPEEGLPQEGGLLEEGLKELNLPKITGKSLAAILAPLQKYTEEIELFNEAYGLVKVKDRREFVVKHLLDSLAPLEILTRLLADMKGEVPGPEEKAGAAPKVWRIADVGSGAGLPGIPLSVCLPDAEFTLIERMGRRAGFLRNCAAVLGLPNVRVEETEMEKAAPGHFDLAVFRAFRPLEPAILKGLIRLLKPGGFLAAWKGRMESSREEMRAAEKSLPGLRWELYPLTVPFLGEERRLAVIGPSAKGAA